MPRSRRLPAWAMYRGYSSRSFRRDIAAGVVLSALLVPAGMGYAQAAGLPPVYGLYATMAPLVAYALVGPSPVLVFGPDSSLAPLIAATVLPLAAGDPQRAVALAGMLAVLSGFICVVGGMARFGFATDLLSLPVRYGYMNGIALTVAVSQLPKLLGFRSDGDGVIAILGDVVAGLRERQVRGGAVAVSVTVLTVIVVLRRLIPKLPGVLLAVVLAILIAIVFDLEGRGVAMVGVVPRRLPSFGWPAIGRDDLGGLLAGGFGIAMVSFADTSLLSRTFAARRRVEVDSNHELLALGVANVASGLFHGFSVSASASRTPVAEAAGARTQVAGVVGAAVIGAVLLGGPGLFRNLPTAALAAVVVAASFSLIEVRSMARLARVRPGEFALAFTTFGAVALAGATRGVLISIAVSLLAFVVKAWRPHTTTLVRVDGLKGYHDVVRHPEGQAIPGLLLYRFDAPLFFANAELFRDQIRHLVSRGTDTRWVVVTAEPITDIDATASEVLSAMVDELHARGVVLAFAELKGRVREQLDKDGLVERLGRDRFYRTIGEAVHAYLAAEGVTWIDWEDRAPGEP